MRQIDNGTTKIKVCYSAEEMREMSYGINGMLERIQKQNEESIQKGGSAERYGNPGNAEPD